MDPSIIPSTITIDNFFVLFDETDFGQYLLNSVIVAIGTSTLTVCLALLGGYGLARSEFRGQRNLARGILFTYMFPYILIGLPLYYMFYRIGLLNTYLGLVLAQTAIALPFSMWLMWQFFQTIPLSFEESAWICGASKLRTFVEIVLPMSLPGMIAISIFSFAVSWSDFTFAVIVMTENAMKTFPVGLFEMMSQDNVHWGMLTAAGTIIMIPAFVLVYFLQRYILIGFTIGE